MPAELGGSQLSSLLEALPGIARRLRRPVADALVKAIPTAVSPADIPALIARTQQEPTNADVRFRLAAALAAAERYDTAIVVARAGELLAPDNALGPLIIGGCQEQAGRYDLAVATYRDFANAHRGARGVAALRARAQLACRAGAEQTARQALARETELAQQPPEPATLAVLPLVIAGDSSFQPLSRDRKSTRLNSSHTVSSYAVFCLKKKNRERYRVPTAASKEKLYTR